MSEDAPPEEDYVLFVNEERTMLVRLWLDGSVEASTREDAYAVWAPPIAMRQE